MLIKPPPTKRSARRVKSTTPHAHAKTTHRTTGTAKGKTLAQTNHWMEANADLVMKIARQNTLRLTGKEGL